MNTRTKHQVQLITYYDVECFDAQGNLKWTERVKNMTLDAGLNDLLNVQFKSGTQHTAWYVGLKGTGTIAAGDTSASHSGWTETTAYTAGTRPAWTGGSVSGKSVDNSGSAASFAMNGAYTVAGAFLATSAAKSSSTDVIYGAADFATPRSGASGDTINVTVTLTAATA